MMTWASPQIASQCQAPSQTDSSDSWRCLCMLYCTHTWLCLPFAHSTTAIFWYCSFMFSIQKRDDSTPTHKHLQLHTVTGLVHFSSLVFLCHGTGAVILLWDFAIVCSTLGNHDICSVSIPVFSPVLYTGDKSVGQDRQKATINSTDR